MGCFAITRIYWVAEYCIDSLCPNNPLRKDCFDTFILRIAIKPIIGCCY